MDYEEALRYSGTKDLDSAFEYFVNVGSPAFVITRGANGITAYSSGGMFEQ